MTRKRLFDLALLLPVLPFVVLAVGLLALGVLLLDGRPLFFFQRRVGQRRRPFRIFKLRTMTCELDPKARTVTRSGAFLRQRGLDELPQLFNVLSGDMSLVGPRPLEPSDADRLSANYPPFAARFAVPPGLTGLAQVCQARGVEANARCDAHYVTHSGVWFDLQILFRTVWINVVGKKRGAAAEPASTSTRAEDHLLA